MSEQKLGPHCYYQDKEYRIEEFFVSRPLSIFEMRVDHFLKLYAEKICDFHHNADCAEKVEKIIPKEKWFVDAFQTEWLEEVQKIVPEMSATVTDESSKKVI